MFGVLVDVSGSMRSALSVDESHRPGADVERTRAILTSTLNIVKQEVAHHQRQDSVFVSAFGLDTCDLLSLLELLKESKLKHGCMSLYHRKLK